MDQVELKMLFRVRLGSYSNHLAEIKPLAPSATHTSAMINSCLTCSQSLVTDIELENDNGGPETEQLASHAQTVPDAVELTSGSHFHWFSWAAAPHPSL